MSVQNYIRNIHSKKDISAHAWCCLLFVALCAQARAQGQCEDSSFYKNASGVCVACPGANQIDGGIESGCICMANYYREDSASDCNACPHGTSTPQGDNLQMTTCSCAPGHSPYFDKSLNNLTCSICPQNTYLESNQILYPGDGLDLSWKYCDACPQNSFSTTLGANSKDVCAGPGYCKADTYWRAPGGTCSACPAHSGNPETPSTEDAATLCQCDAGYRSEVDGSGVQTCVACAPGSYAAASGANACTACANGTSAGAAGAAGCEPCAAGWHTLAPGASTCLQDPAPPEASNSMAAEKADAAETAETAETGGMSAGAIAIILVGVAVGLALCAKLVQWVRQRHLARVRNAEAHFVPVLPASGYQYAQVYA